MPADAQKVTIPEPKAPATPYDRLGGAPVFAEIAKRFYDLMETDPAYAELRAMHAPDLNPMRKALAGFLSGWAGGPRDWFEANPGRCMMSIHKPFAIDPNVAGQWAEAMERAIADTAPEPAGMAQALSDTLGDMARGMGR